MRPWLLLLLVLVPLPAHAESPPWEDAEGDAQGPIADGAMDLRSLAIQEDEAGFAFELTVGALDGTADWRLDAGRWYIHVDHEDMQRRIQLGRSLDGYWWASLEEANNADADGFAWVAGLSLERDDAAGVLRTYVERGLLADGSGAPPVAGRELTGIHVRSQSHVGDMSDRLPDDGLLELPVALGPVQSGDIALASADPWRATNGAASTYIYTVQVDNAGPATDITLDASDVPSGWSVLLPTPVVALDADSSAEVPVVLQTPFAHVHGARESFIVEARSDRAGDIGRVELGLEFLAVPQPSGHHDTLWIHSRSQNNPAQPINELVSPGGYNSYLVMNAVEDEEADTQEPKEGRPAGIGASQRPYWWMPLSPQLRMGLDFDLESSGTIEVPFRTPVALGETTLHGWMYHCVPVGEDYDCNMLASLESEPVSLDTSAVFTAAIVPEEIADRVEYTPKSYLSLSLQLRSPNVQTGTGVDQVELMPGGWLQLPLDEYADDVDELFGSDALMLDTVAPEISVNPGAPQAFEVILDNRLSDAIDVSLEISGTHAEWAHIEGDAERRLDALGREVVRVVVTPDEGAAIGDRADLILHARSDAGSSLVRLVATVSEERLVPIAEVPDKESPGLGAGAFLLMAFAGAARRRG